MSYALELYAVDWNALTATLGRADGALVERIASRASSLFPDGIDDAEGRRLVFRRTLDAFLFGPRGLEIAARGPLPEHEEEELSDVAAIVFSNILSATGSPLGALDHSSTGGPAFRDDFLLRLPLLLGVPFDFTLLIARPLFGLTHPSYPSWGGLHRDEIAAIVDREPDPPPLTGDDDVDLWLHDLHEALTECSVRKTDLVTIYW